MESIAVPSDTISKSPSALEAIYNPVSLKYNLASLVICAAAELRYNTVPVASPSDTTLNVASTPLFELDTCSKSL